VGLSDNVPFSKKALNKPIEEAVQDKSLPIRARAIEPKSTNGFSFLGNPFLKNKKRYYEFEDSPFDFKRISAAIDTDSYVKQAFAKYRDLFWKEGWTITGENSEAVDYIWARLSSMERLMGQSIESFLTEVVDELLRYGNVFIAIARADVSKEVKGKSSLEDSARPNMTAGLYIIPTETVSIRRDKFNRPTNYAQKLSSDTKGEPNKKNLIQWLPEDVIHLYLDKKPGRAFGTPSVEAVLDDVVSLRQLEQDILDLSHRELFPLYLYRVGDDKFPAKEGDLEKAVSAVEDLKSEGGLVAPGNHSVEVLGAEGSSLDVTAYLAHFKERVAIGLGVSPHHLGMMGTSSNRSVTERLDLALYDKIKHYQSYFENSLRLHLFNGILRQGGFSPEGNLKSSQPSDACFIEFNEIDIDTQIKKENHYVDLFTKSAISWEESREKLKKKPELEDGHHLFMLMQAEIQAEIAQATQPATQPSGSNPDKKTPAPKGQINLPNVGKSTGAKDRPINQHGRLQSPNVKNHLDITNQFIENIVDILKEEEENE
jgi:hypothetical protein